MLKLAPTPPQESHARTLMNDPDRSCHVQGDTPLTLILVGVLGVSPLSRAVGLYEADDGGSGQGLRGKDAPLQLDPETCEWISPQDDFACFHMINLPPWADRAGRQRH